MDEVKLHAMKFLSSRERRTNDAVMFDIDDALIRVDTTPIREMVSLYKFAEMLGYKMIIITARPYYEQNAMWTASQLLEVGINPVNLYFTPPQLKGDAKQQLGYNFVLSVGDQWTDLTDTEKWVKLPDTFDGRIISN
tara:strand:- start:28151 stop:28561 length:411 start_codon:yes stop_codon:yes gene_type:complete